MGRGSWTLTGVSVLVAALAGAGVLVASGSHPAASAPLAPGAAPSATTVAPPPPLTVVSVVHASAAAAVYQLGAVKVTFSAPVGPAVRPVLSPTLAGTWDRPSATTATFTPAAVPLPGETFTVSLPKGTADVAGGTLAAAYRTSWTTPAASPARLQQALAEAGYLPLTFRPATPEPTTVAALTAAAYAPVAGTYAWRFTPPPALRALFTGATSTLLTHGALLAFESAHGLTPDGIAGPRVWSALVADASTGTVSHLPYTDVYVTKAKPETLTVYRDGVPVLTTKANTGVAGAATPDGSWAVYARFPSQTMSGTNPDGTHYSDPGVPWISYFLGGDAVHGFPRASYGSPQSVGCVELPIATAKTVYGLLGYGDIVTIAG